MDATCRAEQLEAATKEADAARFAYETARTKKAKREAAEDLEFWTNKTAFLTHAR